MAGNPAPSEDFEALLASGQAAKVVESLDPARVAAEPGLGLYLGRALHDLARHQEAIEALEKARVSAEHAAPALAAQSLTLLEMQRPEEALRKSEQALELDANLPEALKNLAMAKIRLGDWQGAEAALDRALQCSPAHAGVYMVLALLRLTQKRLDDAERALVHTTVLDPRSASAFTNLGLTYRLQGRLDEAERALAQALELRPEDANTLNNLGLVHKDKGDLERAESCFIRAREIAPRPNYSMNLVALYRQSGRHAEAAEVLLEAYERNPGNLAILADLPGVLLSAGRVDEAVRYGQTMVENKPERANAHYNLAVAYMHADRQQEAEAAALRATELDPNLVDALICLAQARKHLGRYQLALAAAERALGLRENAAVHFILGLVHKEMEHKEQAIHHLEECLRLEPQDSLGAGVFLATLQGGSVPQATLSPYVRTLFDQYASKYDEHLTDFLAYRGPEILGAALSPWLGDGNDLRVLDLGCGTGLCAPMLRPYASELVGVDLSEKMLDKARACGLYDRLEPEEACAYLQGRADAFDVIVAGDVLVYIGELDALFQAACRSLHRGGFFAFTVEKGESRYSLGSNGRYRHSPDYIEATARHAGFTVRTLEGANVRHENQNPVPGLVVVLQATR